MKKIITAIALYALSFWASATTLNPIQLLNPAGSTSGQAIVSTGSSSAPAWGGVGLNGIAAIAGNTLIGNATSSSAVPTAVPVSNCAGTSSALNYTSGTGFSCNGSINALTVSGNAIGTSGGTIPLLSGVNTWSGAQTFSALITPSSTIGIKGTAGNDSANAGSIGEFATNSATGISMTSPSAANIASISLTAGDWDVIGNIAFNSGAGATPTTIDASLSTTSTTVGPLGSRARIQATLATAGTEYLVTPVVRISVSSTTTVFLVAASTFSGGTLTCDGLIRARRVR